VPWDYEDPVAQMAPIISGEIYPGGVESHEVLVSDATGAALVLYWPEDELSLILTTPSGTLIDPATAESDPYVTFYEENPALYEMGYIIKNPEQGIWTVNVSAVDVPQEGVKYGISAFLGTETALSIAPGKNQHEPGEHINITAELTHGTQGIIEATVAADIRRPDDTIDNIILYDDGLHNDSQANDGVYANEYTNTSLWGMYTIIVTGSGLVNGEEFERQDFSTAWVKLYPDLSIDASDISFSNNSPNEGENITINATIHNIGDADAGNASILFYDGEPKWGNQIGENVVTVLSGGSAEASVSWTAVPGDHVIYVGTSPFNTMFYESDYSNNAAFKSIHVTGPAVVADAGGPYIGDEGYPVIFYAGGSTDPGGAPLQYRWDYNSDGNWDISWSNIPIGGTAWADDGSRSVTVEVSNGVLSSRDTVNVIVRNVAPTVQIVAETQTPGDSHVMFDGSNFTDPGIEDTHTIEWDFGDGEYATDTMSPTHAYDQTGEYTVTLTVTDDGGGVGTDTLTVSVNTVSDIPVAVDDDYSILEDTILEVAAPGVLTNDSDVEPTAIMVGNVSNGALTLNTNGSFTYIPDAEFNGIDTFTYKAVAGAAESNVAIVTITVSPVNDWPDVIAGSDQTVNLGDSAVFSGSFTDPDSDNFTIEWDFGDGEYATGTLSPNHVYTEGGLYTLILMISDDEGAVGWDMLTLTVTAGPTAAFTWSPEPQDEGSPVQFADASTYSSAEIVAWDWDFGGYGASTSQNTSFAFMDNGPFDVCLTVTDDDGSTDTIYQTVTTCNVAPVLENITAPVDPVEVGTPITASANFSDAGTLDTHTALWNWGGNTTSAGIVTETDGFGSVTGNHSYNEAGVYTLILTVEDDDGDLVTSEFRYIVVYDPEGGFVTGGGWINSPEGAYAADPTLTGKANFGFVSKYKHGAATPTGNTQFRFKAGDLNFHSSCYDWLVVAHHKAMYMGTGTINGEGDYGFMLTAIDEELTPSTDVDLCRIKIWDKDNDDTIVYDNQMGAEDDEDPTTEIQGGNIIIHD